MTNLFDMTGKVAIVTGSSRGIGEAIAHALADHGAKVTITSRNVDDCQKVVDAINARHPDSAIAVASSLSAKDSLQAMVDATVAAFGPVDVLICNAASNPHYGPMATITDEQFRKTLDNNIVAQHWLIQAVAPSMIARKSGSIVIVSSIGGLRGSPIIGAYAITKAADIQMTKNLAREYGPSNVRINTIAPGLVRTDFAKALWENPENLKNSTSNAALGRIGEPHEIAGAAVYLASDASSFMTGQTIVIDGGVVV